MDKINMVMHIKYRAVCSVPTPDPHVDIEPMTIDDAA